MSQPHQRQQRQQNLVPGGETDDIYDDACDLGQFCLNPCWFMFVKLRKLSTDSNGSNHDCDPDGGDDKAENKKANRPKTTTSNSMWWQQIAYAVAVFGSWIIIFARGYPLFRSSPHVSHHHLANGYLVFGACVLSWILARYTSPGIITLDTMSKFDNYPYDNLLYVRNNICPTMGIPKLARSKYDKYTQKHVPRFDHYCGWIQQSVGEENYRFFLLFLTVHVFMCLYGSTITFTALWGENDNDDATFYEKIVTALCLDYGLTAVLLLMGCMTFLLAAFLSFHIFILSKGMTTNEYYKWKIVYERHSNAVADRYDTQQSQEASGTDDHDDEEANTAANAVRVVNGATNHRSPVMLSFPIPVNLYDLGFLANLYEVLFPRSLRNEMHHKKL